MTMIGIDAEKWAKIQAQKKGLEYMIFFCVLVILISLWFVVFGPQSNCIKWGGTYFEDGSCHLIEDLDLCLTDQGAIKTGPSQISINWSVE